MLNKLAKKVMWNRVKKSNSFDFPFMKHEQEKNRSEEERQYKNIFHHSKPFVNVAGINIAHYSPRGLTKSRECGPGGD